MSNYFDNLPIELQELIMEKKKKLEVKPLLHYQEFIYKNTDYLYKFNIGNDFDPICPHNAIYERLLVIRRLGNYPVSKDTVLSELITLSTPELISYERNTFGVRVPNGDIPKTKKGMVDFYRRMGYKFVNLNKWKVAEMKQKIESRLNEWITDN